MFPLIAIGAAALGTVLLASNSSSEPQKRNPKSESSQQAVSPQSYIVTPISNEGSRIQAFSIADHINRFIV